MGSDHFRGGPSLAPNKVARPGPLRSDVRGRSA